MTLRYPECNNNICRKICIKHLNVTFCKLFVHVKLVVCVLCCRLFLCCAGKKNNKPLVVCTVSRFFCKLFVHVKLVVCVLLCCAGKKQQTSGSMHREQIFFHSVDGDGVSVSCLSDSAKSFDRQATTYIKLTCSFAS